MGMQIFGLNKINKNDKISHQIIDQFLLLKKKKVLHGRFFAMTFARFLFLNSEMASKGETREVVRMLKRVFFGNIHCKLSQLFYN